MKYWIFIFKRSDIANSISRTDYYDFLIDVVEESCQNKSQLCGNYHIIPAASVIDEGLRQNQQYNNNQDLINYSYNDINNYISNINQNEVINFLY